MSIDPALRSVAELVRERNQLRARVDELSDPQHEARLVRLAYRRGWNAGRMSKQRGQAHVNNPEISARGWIREAVSA